MRQQQQQHRFSHILLWMSLGCIIGYHVANNLDNLKGMLLPGHYGTTQASIYATAKDNSFFSHCPSFDTNSTPQPVILISKGRSGSSATWEIMGNLTGFVTNNHKEYTGANVMQQRDFFHRHKDENWLVDVMCERRLLFDKAGIVGIKWKLSPELFHYPGVQDAFQFIVRNKQPGVKVIYSTRNVLDVHISEYKHSLSQLPSHCEDDQCLEKVLKASTGLKLPTRGLVRILRKATKENEETERFLKDWKVPYLKVTYEKLYSGDDDAVHEWKRVFRFLGQGPADSLTLGQLQGSMQTKVTFVKQHNRTLVNYNQVRKVLTGTEFESLLH